MQPALAAGISPGCVGKCGSAAPLRFLWKGLTHPLRSPLPNHATARGSSALGPMCPFSSSVPHSSQPLPRKSPPTIRLLGPPCALGMRSPRVGWGSTATQSPSPSDPRRRRRRRPPVPARRPAPAAPRRSRPQRLGLRPGAEPGLRRAPSSRGPSPRHASPSPPRTPALSGSPRAPPGPFSRARRPRAAVGRGGPSPRARLLPALPTGPEWAAPPSLLPASLLSSGRPRGGRDRDAEGPRTTPATRSRGLRASEPPQPPPQAHLFARRAPRPCAGGGRLSRPALTHPPRYRARSDRAQGPSPSLARSLARTRGHARPHAAGGPQPSSLAGARAHDPRHHHAPSPWH